MLEAWSRLCPLRILHSSEALLYRSSKRPNCSSFRKLGCKEIDELSIEWQTILSVFNFLSVLSLPWRFYCSVDCSLQGSLCKLHTRNQSYHSLAVWAPRECWRHLISALTSRAALSQCSSLTSDTMSAHCDAGVIEQCPKQPGLLCFFY